MLVYQRVRDDICKLSDMRIWCEFQNLGSKAWKWLNTELAGNLSLLTFWYKSDKLMLCVPSIHHIWEVGVLCEKRSLNNKTTKPNQHHCSLVFFLFNFSLANCNASPTSKYTEMNLKWYLFPIFVEMSHCISHFSRPKNIHSKSYHDKSQVVTADTQLRPHTSCILNGASRAAVVSLVTFFSKEKHACSFFGAKFPRRFHLLWPYPSPEI